MRGNDKRGARRDRHDSVVEFFNAAGKLLGSGRLVDFSGTGASFSSAYIMAVGARLKLRVRLLEKGVLEIAAKVVWARKESPGYLYGVRFDNVNKVGSGGELRKLFK